MSIATRDVEAGYEIPTISRIARLREDYPPTSIHHDAFAKKMGWSGALVPGAQETGYITEILVNFFGESWFEHGSVAVTFIAPVIKGDTLAARGRVQEKQVEDASVRLMLQVWCENQDGKKVAVGTASCLVT